MNEDAFIYYNNQLKKTVKVMAELKITEFLPTWKQNNFESRRNDLRWESVSRELSNDEQQELVYINQAYVKRDAIRAASDMHESALLALTTLEEVHEYEEKQLSANWPSLGE
jgi:hypothetical protein